MQSKRSKKTRDRSKLLKRDSRVRQRTELTEEARTSRTGLHKLRSKAHRSKGTGEFERKESDNPKPNDLSGTGKVGKQEQTTRKGQLTLRTKNLANDERTSRKRLEQLHELNRYKGTSKVDKEQHLTKEEQTNRRDPEQSRANQSNGTRQLEKYEQTARTGLEALRRKQGSKASCNF